MKNYLPTLLIATILFFPTASFAFPAFPMAFWGDATLDGNPAPVNTVIKAYYGDTLAGQVVVQEEGIYGYSESIKQKLIVGEGEGAITFKLGEATPLTHPSFVSGEVLEKDLAFSNPIPIPTPTPTPSNSGGGGGGGGSSSSSGSGGGGGGGGGGGVAPVVPTQTLSSAAQKVDVNSDNKVDVLDFNSLMVNWGSTTVNNVADFNNDNKVDLLDFNLLMVNWSN